MRKVVSVIISGLLVVSIMVNMNLMVRATEYEEIIRVSPSEQYQTFEGWGTSLCWWGNVVGGWENEDKKDELVELLFDEENGLGFNILRYNIGGGENPAHTHMGARVGSAVPGFKATENSEYDWSADENQISIMRKAKALGVDIFDAFSNSAPYWMTKNNCASGNWNGSNNLKDDYYDDFAKYLVDVVEHFRTEEGIQFQTLIPVNEPSGIWWVGQAGLVGGNNQEGMHFDIPNQEIILKQVYQELEHRGLLTYTRVSGPEEYTPNETNNTVRNYGQETVQDLARINTHTYGDADDRTQTEALRMFAQENQKKIWVSETGFDGTGDRNNIDSSINLTKGILKDLKDLKADAWVYWQAVEDAAPDQNWGLIDAAFTGENEYYITKQYYGMASFSKFIRPGYKIIKIDHYMSLAAYDANEGTLVLVTLNDTDSSKNYRYDLSEFTEIGTVASIYRTSATENCAAISTQHPVNDTQKVLELTEVPAKSITTVVLHNVQYSGINMEEQNDDAFSYTGDWIHQESADVHIGDTQGQLVQIPFYGTDIQLFGNKGPEMGIATVSLDGGPEVSVDGYAAVSEENTLIYSSPQLTRKEHVLTLCVTGSKHPLSSGTNIVLDRAVINHGIENLLINGGFESKSLAPWTGVWNGYLAGVEDTFPQFGLSDGYLHPNLVADVGMEQTITAPAAKTYTLTVYAATNKNGTSLGVDIDGVQAASCPVQNDGTYHRYELSFEALEGQQIKVWYYTAKGSGWATLDEAILR